MTIFYKNLGGDMVPSWLRLCFAPPRGNFLRTPLCANLKMTTTVAVRMVKICSSRLFRMDVVFILVVVSRGNRNQHVVLRFLQKINRLQRSFT